ncbi:MAG: bifunctional adenosylcobinamide kinase/adenosylcobinamide-phosphate guanylyltransferase [Planctomycetota bacterium]|nr:bifunctional adenosylcobinamide kinase/adenosylcobinamide-phosphate guanylyltransferase [Planctomycetota bacterium]
MTGMLVTGGARSGKSRYALERALAQSGPRTFIATCQPWDEEMRDRVARHKAERAAQGWHTVEEQVDPAAAIAAAEPGGAVVLDCLTLWLCNLFERDAAYGQDQGAADAAGLAQAMQAYSGLAIAVTNEIGLGVVPGDAVSRRYRDTLGRMNQVLGTALDEVVLVVCGRALHL